VTEILDSSPTPGEELLGQLVLLFDPMTAGRIYRFGRPGHDLRKFCSQVTFVSSYSSRF
jgi:hypothetical protein